MDHDILTSTAESEESYHDFEVLGRASARDAMPDENRKLALLGGLSEIDAKLKNLKESHRVDSSQVKGVRKETEKYTHLLGGFRSILPAGRWLENSEHHQDLLQRDVASQKDSTLSSIEFGRGAPGMCESDHRLSLSFIQETGGVQPVPSTSAVKSVGIGAVRNQATNQSYLMSDVVSGPLSNQCRSPDLSVCQEINLTADQEQMRSAVRKSLLTKWSERYSNQPLATSSMKGTPEKLSVSKIHCNERKSNSKAITMQSRSAQVSQENIFDPRTLESVVSKKPISSLSFNDVEERLKRLKGMIRTPMLDKSVQVLCEKTDSHEQTRLDVAKSSAGQCKRPRPINKAQMPFVAGKSTGPSHSLRANIQELLAQLKTENPKLLEEFLSFQPKSEGVTDLNQWKALILALIMDIQKSLEQKISEYYELSERIGINGSSASGLEKEKSEKAAQIERLDNHLTRLRNIEARLCGIINSNRSGSSHCSVRQRVKKFKSDIHFDGPPVVSSITRHTESSLLKRCHLPIRASSERRNGTAVPNSRSVQALRNVKSLKSAFNN